MFDHYRGDNEPFTLKMWKPLVHVCRRWRYIVFGSPLRLHLRLVCDVRTPVRKLLNIWPPLPIIIRYSPNEDEGVGNVIDALEHHHRISSIDFEGLTSHVLKRFITVMQEPLLVLTGLRLQCSDDLGSAIPDTFLGGSAPQLQILVLEGIAFPTFPGFVLPATHLTKLQLQKIPDAGYISPEVMVTCLSVLLELEELVIGFQSSHPISRDPPPLTRVILPALTYFEFRGVREYLEDLVARIITPELHSLDIWFFLDLIFDIPQLRQFIHITNTLRLCKRVCIELYPWSARINVESPTPLHLGVKCERLDWQVSSMAQLCNGLIPLLSEVELLEVNGDPDLQVESEEVDSRQWLELFHPFTAVQDLYVSKKLGPLIARALTKNMVTEVLPSLQRLYLEGPNSSGAIQEVLARFLAARHRPIIVKRWEQDTHWDPEDDDQ